MGEARYARLEHRPVGGDARRAHRGQGDPVVAELARDDLVFARLAPELPVVAGHLDVGVGRFPAAGGEVEPVDAGVGEPRQALRQLDGVRVRAAGIAGCIAELVHLCGCRVRELLAPVPAGVVPKPRQSVDERIAVGVVEHRALATDPHLPCAWTAPLCSGWIRWLRSRSMSAVFASLVMHVSSLRPADRGGVGGVRPGRCAGRRLPGGSWHGNGIRRRYATGPKPDRRAAGGRRFALVPSSAAKRTR